MLPPLKLLLGYFWYRLKRLFRKEPKWSCFPYGGRVEVDLTNGTRTYYYDSVSAYPYNFRESSTRYKDNRYDLN